MQGTVQDLINDYEIISKEASSCHQYKYRYIEVESKNVRDYILLSREVRREDLRFDKVVCCASEVRDFVKATLDTLGFAYLAAEEQLHNIAYLMMSRFKLNRLNCRMELIYSGKCKRFHVDNVYLRAITTLLGPGTELQLLGESGRSQHVRTGDTVLLKGKKFPGEMTKVLHKSPKISHLRSPRVVFVMDY